MSSELDLSVQRELSQAKRSFIERDFSFSLLGSVTFHGLFLLASWLMPPTAAGLSIDMTRDDTRYARYLIEQVEVVPPPFLLASEGGEAGSKPAPGDAGKAGTPDASKQPKKRATKGDSKAGLPPPADARIASSAGILGVLAGSIPHDLGGLFDPHVLAGTDADTWLGSLQGRELGASAGFGGLHMRNVGRGGGGDPDGSIGLDRLGTVGTGPGGDGAYGNAIAGLGKRRGARVPVLHSYPAQVLGSLSKEVIRRTVSLHLAEIRFCYEQGRIARADLAGRISVGFVIAPSGSVQNATIVHSDLTSPSTESCIQAAVRRWAFPQPENGGVVSVTYPFVLQATE